MILGIDPSSKTIAVAWLGPGGWGMRKFILTETCVPETMKWARKVMVRLFDRLGIEAGDVVFLEEPVVAGARNIRSTIKQAYLNGVVQEVITTYGATCVPTPINTWKASTVGGGATKERVAAWLQEAWPLYYEAAAGDQDLIDAGAILLHGSKHSEAGMD